jgi:hypothetical protein
VGARLCGNPSDLVVYTRDAKIHFHHIAVTGCLADGADDVGAIQWVYRRNQLVTRKRSARV